MPQGIIIVDHGSSRGESNRLLECLCLQFATRFADRHPIVEAAHMELAEPSIATAYARCVQRGATEIVISPFFLGPGKHWTQDIPALASAAAANHPGTTFQVARTLGIDDLILDLLAKRISQCTDCDPASAA